MSSSNHPAPTISPRSSPISNTAAMDDFSDSQQTPPGSSGSRNSPENTPLRRSASTKSTKSTSPERRLKSRMNKPSLEPVIEGAQRLLRDIRTPSPSDANRLKKKNSRPELLRQRSSNFEETFVSREMDLLGDIVRSEAIVMAEVKTNVIVHDEYTFVKELSQHLAVRYHRQLSSIVVTLKHSACIYFGGCCDPAYVMTVEALAPLVQMASNKRNVVLLQQHMEQALGVPPSRGYCRFIPIAEECSGWKGKTVASQIADVSGGRPRADSQTRRPWTSSKDQGYLSDSPLDKLSPGARPSTADASGAHGDYVLDPSPEYGPSAPNGVSEVEKVKGLKRRKSFMHNLFNRASSRQGIRA